MAFIYPFSTALLTFIILVFVEGIKEQYVKKGMTTTLRCQHNSVEKTHVWSGPENFTTYSVFETVNSNISKHSRLSIKPPENSLVIENVSYEDVGVYQCLTVHNGTPVQYDVELIIAEAPSNMFIANTTSQHILYEREGSDIVLQCNVRKGIPAGDLIWKNSNRSLASTISNELIFKMTANRQSHLQFYTCEANNGFYQMLRTIQLFLSLKPVVQVRPEKEFTVKEGENVTMVCSNSTNTLPTKSIWKFNDITIRSDQSELHLYNVTQNNTGSYSCEVTNEIGVGNATVDITVKYKPYLLQKNVNFVFEAEIYKSTDIKFVVGSLIKPDISWKTSAGGIRGSWNVIKYREESFSIQSTVVPRTQNHLGNYSIKIRNDVGSLDIGFTLVSNLITLKPATSECNVSSYVLFECALQMETIVGLYNTWTHEFDNTVVRNIQSIISGNVSSITIPFCDYRDSGSYICKWISQSFEYTASASLMVNDIPIIIEKHISVVLNNIRLEVRFYSAPPAKSVVWLKNDNQLQNGFAINASETEMMVNFTLFGISVGAPGYQAVILIQHEFYTGKAEYTCKITNIIGNLETAFTTKEINTALETYEVKRNKTHRSHVPIENDKSLILNTLLYSGSSLVIIVLFVLGICLLRKLYTRRTQTVSVSTEVIQSGNRTVNSVSLPPVIVQNTSFDDNEYDEVGFEQPVEIREEHLSPSSSSTQTSVSDRSYLDMDCHSYEEITRTEIEHHEYMECVLSTD